MSGRVVFALTEQQRDALLALRAGALPDFNANRWQARLWQGMVRRGWLTPGYSLTPLGGSVVALADRLANVGGQ